MVFNSGTTARNWNRSICPRSRGFSDRCFEFFTSDSIPKVFNATIEARMTGRATGTGGKNKSEQIKFEAGQRMRKKREMPSR